MPTYRIKVSQRFSQNYITTIDVEATNLGEALGKAKNVSIPPNYGGWAIEAGSQTYDDLVVRADLPVQLTLDDEDIEKYLEQTEGTQCPVCSSNSIYISDLDNSTEAPALCNNCGAEWTVVYSLSFIKNITLGK